MLRLNAGDEGLLIQALGVPMPRAEATVQPVIMELRNNICAGNQQHVLHVLQSTAVTPMSHDASSNIGVALSRNSGESLRHRGHRALLEQQSSQKHHSTSTGRPFYFVPQPRTPWDVTMRCAAKASSQLRERYSIIGSGRRAAHQIGKSGRRAS